MERFSISLNFHHPEVLDPLQRIHVTNTMEREVARPITPTQAEMEKESAEHIHVEGKPTDMPSSHDNALDIFDGRPEEFVYTSKEATRVRWKIDLIMLPMVKLSHIYKLLSQMLTYTQ